MVVENYKKLNLQIQALEKKNNRKLGSVKLLAVSKGQDAQKIRDLYACGQRAFAENYLQEARAKMMILQDLKIEWHFIGRIQRNKIKLIADSFSWIHSVSSLLLAESFSKHRSPHLPPLNICLQIQNTSTQIGISEKDLLSVAQICKELPNICLRGLMCMPPPYQDEKKTEQMFAHAYELFEMVNREVCQVDTLSMGMSLDYLWAIAHGATIIRIGTLLFGEREYV